MLLALAAFFWTKALRWSLLLRPVVRLRARELVSATVIGVAGNNLLPARLGEALRLLAISREFQVSKVAMLSTLVLERTFDLVAILASLALAVQMVPSSGGLERMRAGAFGIGLACLLALLLFFGSVLRPKLCLRLAGRLLSPFPQGIQRKLQESVGLAILGLSSLRSAKTLLALLSLSAVHWTLNALCLYWPAISVAPGSRIPFMAAFLLNGIVALGVTLPTAPGQIGTLQLCFIVGLLPFGVSEEKAVAASIYASLLGFVPVTITGLFLILKVRRRSPGRAGGDPRWLAMSSRA
jgi:hypothetical protein